MLFVYFRSVFALPQMDVGQTDTSMRSGSLVVNHMARLCFHTPLHWVLRGALTKHQLSMNQSKLDETSTQSRELSSKAWFLVCKLYKGKASGGTIGQSLNVNTLHLVPQQAWGAEGIRGLYCRCRKILTLLTRWYTHACSPFARGLAVRLSKIAEHCDSGLFSKYGEGWPGHIWQSDQWPCLHWCFFEGRQQRQ